MSRVRGRTTALPVVCQALQDANSDAVPHSPGMDDVAGSAPVGPRLVSAVVGSPVSRLVTRLWWVIAAGLTAMAYLDLVAATGNVAAPVPGAVFVGALCVMLVVARNASAEANAAGSVASGSLLRAGAFGVLVHGGLVASSSVFAGGSGLALSIIVFGGAFVALTRPTTLVALGLTPDADADVAPQDQAAVPRRTWRPQDMSTPELVGALRTSAAQVRTTSDPVRKAELAERRGALIAILAARDPAALELLLEEPPVGSEPAEDADGTTEG